MRGLAGGDHDHQSRLILNTEVSDIADEDGTHFRQHLKVSE
jgi:hypothetical protein